MCLKFLSDFHNSEDVAYVQQDETVEMNQILIKTFNSQNQICEHWPLFLDRDFKIEIADKIYFGEPRHAVKIFNRSN